MATTSDISKGAFLRYNDELVMVLDYTHITPGKGNAIYTVKSRNVKSGKQNEIRFRSGEKIELVRVETKELQYLYQEGDAMVCMDQETYDQMPIPIYLFGETFKFLKESMIVTVKFDDNDQPIHATSPLQVEMIVAYTEPGLKGDTTSRALKSAELENGALVQVPLFIQTGENIRIDTTTGEYIERVK